jgi:hypothetical protein
VETSFLDQKQDFVFAHMDPNLSLLLLQDCVEHVVHDPNSAKWQSSIILLQKEEGNSKFGIHTLKLVFKLLIWLPGCL